MAVAAKTIVVTVAGVLVVAGAFAAAPLLGDALSQPLAASAGVAGDPVEFRVNASGETYGSPINDNVPQLVLTKADDGDFGYIRLSEFDRQRNAAKSTTNPDAVFSVKVYEADGVAIIGTFTVTADMPSPRDGFNN